MDTNLTLCDGRRTNHILSSTVYDFDDALRAACVSRFIDGSQPVGRDLSAVGIASLADAIPPGFRPVRTANENGAELALCEGIGATVYLRRYPNGSLFGCVTAVDEDRLAAISATLDAVGRRSGSPDGRVTIDFVHHNGCPIHHPRRLVVPAWTDIRRNYPPKVCSAVDRLCGVRSPTSDARLVLWHGPPGTGKTTAIRSLARSWSEWCRTIYVIDPDRLLSVPEYLVQLLLGRPDAGDEGDGTSAGAVPWHLLVLEDADELLRPDAKATSGHALSRLLNLADGFLGQGLQLLILISTNERVDRLHPAVTRPGRCLANVHFGPFDRAGAEAWLGADPGPGAEFTLAELFGLSGGQDPIDESSDSTVSVGQYL